GGPGEREGRIPAGIAPGLEVIADRDRLEAVLLCLDRELHEFARTELLGGRLISQFQHILHLPFSAAAAACPSSKPIRCASSAPSQNMSFSGERTMLAAPGRSRSPTYRPSPRITAMGHPLSLPLTRSAAP